MKLLLDAHLSWRLVKKLQPEYPETIHINQTGLQYSADDINIWEFAKRLSFVILTFDEDYVNLSLRFGHPPKVILIKSFDQSANKVMLLLQSSQKEIEEFYVSTENSLLQIVSS